MRTNAYDASVPFYSTFFGTTPEDPPFQYGDRMAQNSLKSLNYVAGSAGWMISQDGVAEFNDITIRGTLQSANFVAGSAGWRLLDSGTAEFSQVTVRGSSVLAGASITGNLIMTASGKIMTAASGRRMEIATATTSQVTGYTGDGAEQAPGFLDFTNEAGVLTTKVQSPTQAGTVGRLWLGNASYFQAPTITVSATGSTTVSASTTLSLNGGSGGITAHGSTGGTRIASSATNIVDFQDGIGVPVTRAWIERATGRGNFGGVKVQSDWFRVAGNNGIHWDDWGGGWYMSDSTWIRAYGGKSIYTTGEIRTTAQISTLAQYGSTGLYLWNEADTNHRVFYDSGGGGPRVCGWGSAAVQGNQYDTILEAGRGGYGNRHVNIGSSVWRFSDASVHTNMSDPRFKRNMRELPAQAQRVKDIAPIEYQWDEKHDVVEPGRKWMGFDATKLPPEVTKKSFLMNEETGEPEECLMVDPAGVLAIAWQAMRDTIGEVEQAQTRITAQEAKLAANEARLASLERGGGPG